MITDARALRTKPVPQELQHREGTIDQLSSALSPITNGQRGEHSLISGPPGSGKTTVAKFVARDLEREVIDYRWGYVNCLARPTRAQTLYKLASDAGAASDLRPRGHSPSVFIDRLSEMDMQFVGIIDEVNVLEDLGTLVELDYLPNVTLILACVNEDDFYADADGTVLSRFRGAEKVRLERYSANELVDILRNRVEHGLVAGVVAEGVLDEISDRAAGDARHGIVLLRKAVRRAQRIGAEHVTVEDVEETAEDARVEIIERYLSSLGTNMRLLFQIIREKGELRGEELKAIYERRASDPVGDTVRNDYLEMLENHGRIESDGVGRGKRYRIAERKTESPSP